MAKKLTQKERLISKLKRDGYVTRNEALRVFISRLGAIICDLKEEGWDFEAKDVKEDYVYKVVKTPYKTTTYKTEDGRTIQVTK